MRAFARLPYRVRGVLAYVQGQPRLGDILSVAARVLVDGPVGGHLLRLDVVDEDGLPVRYLSREVNAPYGSAMISVPTAFNDPPGVWTIVVTDVNTGTQTRVPVDLGARSALVPQSEPFLVQSIDD